MLNWSEKKINSWHKNMAINTQLSRNYLCYELRPILGGGCDKGWKLELLDPPLAELAPYDRIQRKFQLKQLSLSHTVIRVSDFNQTLHFQVSRGKTVRFSFAIDFLQLKRNGKKWNEMKRTGPTHSFLWTNYMHKWESEPKTQEIIDCQGDVMVKDSFNGHNTSLWSISFHYSSIFLRPPNALALIIIITIQEKMSIIKKMK